MLGRFGADGTIFRIFVIGFIPQSSESAFDEVLKMKFKNPMFVVADMDKTVAFYKKVYFEEDDFDAFAEKLKKFDMEYVHPVKEHSWGQRAVRFYDPDKHIVEVGENMKIVCKRFLDSGMTPEQVAERMDVPMTFVNACMR